MDKGEAIKNTGRSKFGRATISFFFINIVSEWYNSFIFINIVSKQKADIFSILVFNSLWTLNPKFDPRFF
jgi:hypothetical protein